MMFKTFTVGALMALMVVSVPLVYADPQVGGWDKAGWHHDKDKIAKILNLTNDQKKQFEEIHKQQKDLMKATFQQISANRQAFDAEIAKAHPDMTKINDLQNQLKTIQGRMIDNHLNLILQIKKILTPEQYAGYQALEREEMLEHGHPWIHHGKMGKGRDKDEDGD